jgi:hypothetical protein
VAQASSTPAVARVVETPGACIWSPSESGTLKDAGTVTNPSDRSGQWTLRVVWTDQDGVEIDENTDIYPLAPGQSQSWTITSPSVDQPAQLHCSVTASTSG